MSCIILAFGLLFLTWRGGVQWRGKLVQSGSPIFFIWFSFLSHFLSHLSLLLSSCEAIPNCFVRTVVISASFYWFLLSYFKAKMEHRTMKYNTELRSRETNYLTYGKKSKSWLFACTCTIKVLSQWCRLSGILLPSLTTKLYKTRQTGRDQSMLASMQDHQFDRIGHLQSPPRTQRPVGMQLW